jgi:superfamily II DNA or RNA helicase
MSIPFEPGSVLEIRGGLWLLTGVAAHETCTVLTLEGRDRENATERLRLIDPFDRCKRISSHKPRRRPRRAVLRAALGAIVDVRSPVGLWTAARASIDLWAYQLEPALAAINGATRLLLADAVGLGKTIQAGLLLSELRERGWVNRALIVCPAGLRHSWAHELRARFAIHAVVLDQAAIAERVASLPPGVNPWAGHAVAIASIDLVKRPEVLNAIAAQPVDLLIADEAHHLTPGTDRGAAISRLASRATWCVLVSATPHSGDQAAFDYLKNIGARGDALTIFRRSRKDAGHTTARRAQFLAVTPTADEAALFLAIDRYTRAIWQQRGQQDHAARLIAMTLARRAASSCRAIARTLQRRLALLTTPIAEPAQPLLPWDDDDVADQEEPDELLSTPGLERIDEEREWLGRLIELTQRCARPSKLVRLARLLDRIREPAVVFTEYRDSLEAVIDALHASRRVEAIHGGISIDQRRSTVEAFNAGRVDVLVATDAAGEGLNLHHCCRLVIDLELPWNPLRLEQRIGRVDRLGQHRIVHAIRLFHPHTIEARVLMHLRLRDRRAADAFDHHFVTQTMVGRAVFENTPIAATLPTPIASARVVTAAREAARLAHQRLAHASGAARSGDLVWSAIRNGRRADLIALTRLSLFNATGGFAGDSVEARVMSLHPTPNRRECRRLLELERRRLTSSRGDDDLPALARQLEEARTPIRNRIDAIRAGLTQRIEQQSALFDRRTEEESAARLAGARALDTALRRARQAVAAPVRERTRIELIAAWPRMHR